METTLTAEIRAPLRAVAGVAPSDRSHVPVPASQVHDGLDAGESRNVSVSTGVPATGAARSALRAKANCSLGGTWRSASAWSQNVCGVP